MKYGKSKETLALFKEGALSAVGRTQETSHVSKEYEIVSDVTDEGTRTLILRERDLSSIHKMVQEVTEAILAQLGESKSKALRGLLMDTLGDYADDSLERIHKKVVLKQPPEPIKASEGCFKIIVGDGRRVGSEHIMLRE